jgi:beta-glucosidase
MSFPAGFLWGAATSAHQVEGGNTRNDWYMAEGRSEEVSNDRSWKLDEEIGNSKLDNSQTSNFQRPNLVSNFQHPTSKTVPPAGLACDSYNRYEEDFDLAVSLGHNAHRLSLEWSRLEPQEGQFDKKEVEHYRQVLQALRDRGLKSFVTLWHFTLPNWASRYADSTPKLAARYGVSPHTAAASSTFSLRGWESAATIGCFVRYAAFCAREFGDLVDFWITENEPTQVYSLLTHLTGEWPPFKKAALWSYLKVFWHLGQAHNQTYLAIKAVLPEAKVGIVENFGLASPLTGSGVDRLLASLFNFFNHRLSLVLVKNRLDFLGVNHYFHHRVHFDFKNGLQYGDKIDDKLWVSDLEWTLDPRAIYEILLNLSSRARSARPRPGTQARSIPIYITENGLADAADVSRQKFIEETLAWVKKAIDEGANVRGYLHWSLLDNYEWAEGYKAKFGLVAVDFTHGQTRTVRPSALWLRDFIRSSQ